MVSVALVLGAGGIVGGAYHSGVLAALHETTGWDARSADLIVGTSAGSGFGANLRAGFSPADAYRRAIGERLSTEGERLTSGMPIISLPAMPPRPQGIPRPANPALLARVMTGRARPTAALAGILPAGKVPTDALRDRVRHLHPDRWPDRPLWICAVRLSDGRRVVFGRDAADPPDVGTAVAASSAIPGFFEPVGTLRSTFVDGGVHSPTNVDLANGLGFDLVVVVSPMSATRRGLTTGGLPMGRAMHAWTLGSEVRSLRASGTPVLTFQPTDTDVRLMGANLMDPRRAPDVARQAHASARAKLERPDAADAVRLLTA